MGLCEIPSHSAEGRQSNRPHIWTTQETNLCCANLTAGSASTSRHPHQPMESIRGTVREDKMVQFHSSSTSTGGLMLLGCSFNEYELDGIFTSRVRRKYLMYVLRIKLTLVDVTCLGLILQPHSGTCIHTSYIYCMFQPTTTWFIWEFSDGEHYIQLQFECSPWKQPRVTFNHNSPFSVMKREEVG